jgi:hypothetical protein
VLPTCPRQTEMGTRQGVGLAHPSLKHLPRRSASQEAGRRRLEQQSDESKARVSVGPEPGGGDGKGERQKRAPMLFRCRCRDRRRRTRHTGYSLTPGRRRSERLACLLTRSLTAIIASREGSLFLRTCFERLFRLLRSTCCSFYVLPSWRARRIHKHRSSFYISAMIEL